MLICLTLLFLTLLFSFSAIVFGGETLSLDFLALNFSILSVDLALSFYLDTLSYLFFLLVISIGLATNYYTLNYFKNEADEGLFLFWLNSFIASMSILVLAQNYFTLFLGWELIGLTSFFLINFWYYRRATLKSSFKAFTFNLVSDIFLLLSFINFFLATGTNDLLLVNYISLDIINLAYYNIGWGVFFLFIAASIKSVQLGGHL